MYGSKKTKKTEAVHSHELTQKVLFWAQKLIFGSRGDGGGGTKNQFWGVPGLKSPLSYLISYIYPNIKN